VGRETLGRIMNVIGEPVDECGPIRAHPATIFVLSLCLSSNAVVQPAGTADLSATCSDFADAKHHWGIHREAPPFVEQSTAQEILVTGIKVQPSAAVHDRT